MTQPPNIILCTCDQLRAFEVGCYGNPVIRTPNLDRLAAEGVRFETAVTTFPVCMAARSVLLSGQYNRTCTGGVGNVASSQGEGRVYFPQYPHAGRPHLKDETLPEILHRRGYHTATIGKWHIHTWPHDLGFDQYVIPRMNHVHTGQHFSENGGPEFVPDGYSVDFECDRVEAFLAQQAPADRPFFLYTNISPPHCPMSDAPEKYTTMYRPEEIPIRPNVDLTRRLPDQDHWFKVYRWDYRYYNFHLPYTEDLPADFTLQRVIAEYYGMTTWVDDAVGRMLAALEANGLAENTIVVFTSDHGDYLGSHGRVQKGDLHEESVRIPLLVRWSAGLASGVASPQVAALVDLAPTLLDLAGAEIPAHMAGRSLAHLLQAPRSLSMSKGAGMSKGPRFDELSARADESRALSDVLSSSKDVSKGPRFDELSARADELSARADELSARADESRARGVDDAAFIETGRGVGIRTRTHLYGLPFVEGTRDLAAAPHYFWDVAHDPYQLRNLAGTGEQADVAADLDRRLRAWDAATPWMKEA